METQEIYRNEKEIEKKINRAETVLPVVERLLIKFKSNGIEQSLKNIKGFYRSGPEYLKNILLNEAQKDIKKLAITSENMKRNLLNSAINIDEQAYNQLKSEMHTSFGRNQLEVDDITIQENGPALSDEFKETVHEQFTVKLNSEAEQEFWETLKVFCENYNKLEELAEKTGKPSLNEHLDPDYFQYMKMETITSGYTRLNPDANGLLNL